MAVPQQEQKRGLFQQAMDYTKEPSPKKGIFAVREVVHRDIPTIYRTRGMACAVEVEGRLRLLTWQGVINEHDQAKPIIELHRCSKKFSPDRTKYRLEKSQVKQTGSFSFISVIQRGAPTPQEDYTIFKWKVPGDDEKWRDVLALSFIGCKDVVKFGFTYDKGKHELNSPEKKECFFEKFSILGSPIITDDLHVIGVVGEDSDGRLCPYFLTETEVGYQEKEPGDVAPDIPDAPGVLGETTKNLAKLKDAISESKVKSKGFPTLQRKDELSKAVSDMGFIVSDNEGRGNCLFHALSEQLKNGEKDLIPHDVVRETLVQYLRDNPKMKNGTDLFSLLDSDQHNRFGTWKEYLTHMAKDGIWGDEIVIFAAANNYKRDINVIRPLPGDEILVIPIKPECEVKGGNPIWLGHIYDCHFVSLLKDHEEAPSTNTTVPVQESDEKIILKYLPYLALDMQEDKASEMFWRSLGLTDGDIIGFKKDIDKDYERCYKMLKTWWQRDGTYVNLEKALKKHEFTATFEKYCLRKHDPPTGKPEELPKKLKQGCVSKGDLQNISSEVQSKRKRVGRALGLDDEKLDAIEEEHPDNISEQSYQILLKWMRKSRSTEATYHALARALCDRTVMMKHVLNDYCLT